jgi:hypothetical protein
VKVEYASVSALEAWCELRRVCPSPQTSSRTINIKQRANAPDIPDTARPTHRSLYSVAGDDEADSMPRRPQRGVGPHALPQEDNGY